MAADTQNIWLGAVAIAPNGATQAADTLWHSAVNNGPGGGLQHIGTRIWYSFDWDATPAIGAVVEFIIARSDEGTPIVEGGLSLASGVVSVAAALEAARDSLIVSKRIVMSGANITGHAGSFEVFDLPPVWKLAMYVGPAGGASLSTAIELSYRHFDPQGQ